MLALADELPGLLDERRMSLRALGRELDISQSHLSRILKPDESGRVASGELAGRIAKAIGLPEDYFPEFRAAIVHQAIDTDDELRDRFYRVVRRA